MRGSLAASLRSLAAAAAGLLTCDQEAIAALATATARHPVKPLVMGRYAAAMLALAEGDAAAATAALAALAEPALRAPATPRTVTLDPAALGPDAPALYCRLLEDDPATPLPCRAVEPAALAAALPRLAGALAALGPDFADEIAAVAGELVLVVADPGAALHFQGATSPHLWGSMMLNLDDCGTVAALGEALAHESGHAVLFGLTGCEPMVLNPASERYASPLRAEPRPMDGVVHATWVLARMHLAARRMRDSGLLDAAGTAEATATIARTAEQFADGLAVVEAAARFTPAGAAAFAPAAEYMASVTAGGDRAARPRVRGSGVRGSGVCESGVRG